MAYLSTLWLVDNTNKTLCQYNPTSNTIIAKYPIPLPENANNKQPCHVLVSSDKENVYILSPSGLLFKFNTLSKTIAKVIKVSNNASGIAEGVNVINNTIPLFVCNYSDNTVSVIVKDHVLYNIPVGLGPKSIIINSNGFGFVCNELEHTISILSIFKDHYISYKKIYLPSHPLDIISNANNILFVICRDGFLYKFNPLNTCNKTEMKKFDVGKGCIALTIDKDDNPWVLNENGMITKVHTNNTFSAYYAIDDPININSSNTNELYVISKDNALVKIKTTNGSISGMFTATHSITTLGDFTGMRTRSSIIPLDNLVFNEEDLKKLKENVENLIRSYESADDFPDPNDDENLSDKSILLDKTDNTAYRYDSDEKQYKMLYGNSVTSISYDRESSDSTSLDIKKQDGSADSLNMDTLTNNIMAKNNTIDHDEINSLF